MPSWLFLVREALQADQLGPTGIRPPAPRRPAPMVEALNAAVDGVHAKLALHVCFGNAHNKSFATPRRYRPLFPKILQARVDQFLFEYANREMAEIECWAEFPSDKEVGAGAAQLLRRELGGK